MTALSVSAVLGQGGQPESVQEAMPFCLEQTCTSYKHTGGLQFGLAAIDDVITLLSLGDSVLMFTLGKGSSIQRRLNSQEGWKSGGS